MSCRHHQLLFLRRRQHHPERIVLVGLRRQCLRGDSPQRLDRQQAMQNKCVRQHQPNRKTLVMVQVMHTLQQCLVLHLAPCHHLLLRHLFPRSSSRADRLGGPSTTLPSGGQSTATSSAASYAEQMRATAPAESDNVGDGASDAYLAAMSGAASMPQVSPPPPPPPPPAPVSRTERVKPSYTSTDSSTAAGADYLSAMGGGIPQKQPPKAAPKTASSGAPINTDTATAFWF